MNFCYRFSKVCILLTTASLFGSVVKTSAEGLPGMVKNRHDKNGDGKVTRREFTGPDMIFKRLDADGDGTLTGKDFEGKMANLPGRGNRGKGKGKGGNHAEPSWKMTPVSGPNLEYKLFDSEAVGEEVSYLIYLPPGYESGTEAYPVVYWLHGLGGSQQGVPQMCENITREIESGKLKPFIVVFANGMVGSMYCDAVNADVPVESMIIKDLVPHIDDTYRTIANRDSRMIEGFSMGGFGSARLGFKYPELFGSVSVVDGALADLESFSKRHPDIYEQVFDSDPDLHHEAHPFTLLEKNQDKIKGKVMIRVAVGKLVPYNEAFKEKLDEVGVGHEYYETNQLHSPNPVYEALGEKNWDFYNQALAR